MRGWIAAAACGIVLAAISGDPPGRPVKIGRVAQVDPPGLVDRVVTATERAHYVHFTVSVSGAVRGGAKVHVTGGYRFTRPYGVDVVAAITAPGRTGDSQRTDVVAIGPTCYLRAAPGRPWVRFRRDDDVRATHYVRPLVLEIVRALDAVSDWRLLADGGPLHKAGELSDGRHQSGYHAAVRVGEALHGTRGGSHAMFVDIAHRGINRIGYTVWIDRSLRPADAIVGMRYQGRDVLIKAVYTAWGSPVRIAAPSRSTVA